MAGWMKYLSSAVLTVRLSESSWPSSPLDGAFSPRDRPPYPWSFSAIGVASTGMQLGISKSSS